MSALLAGGKSQNHQLLTLGIGQADVPILFSLLFFLPDKVYHHVVQDHE